MARAEVYKVAWLAIPGLAAVAASVIAAPGVPGLAGAALALMMLAIAAIDWRLLIIPNELSAMTLALGFAALSYERWNEMPGPASDALARCGAMAAVFLLFRVGYQQLRGREGMGLGDVKLAGVAGVWLDWTSLPIAVEIAALSALAFVLTQRLRRAQPVDQFSKLPFGAFLAPAIWICWFLNRAWR